MIKGDLKDRTGLVPTGSKFATELPEDWSLVQLGRLGAFRKGRGGSRIDDEAAGVACIRYGDLYKLDRPHFETPLTRIAPAKVSEYTAVYGGEALFALSGESLADIGKSSVVLTDEPTFAGGDLAIFTPSKTLQPEFLGYALSAPFTALQRSQLGRGDIIVHLNIRALRQIVIPIPPLAEQAAIAKYLGHAHARIDSAILAKRKLIALLDEQKLVAINQAVTSGIDQSMPKKDSGVAWLGEIPEHWVTRRAKYLFQEVDVRSGTGKEPLLSLRARAGLVRHEEVSKVPVDPESLVHYKRVQPGEMVMNRMRAASGLFAVATHTGLVSPDYATMKISAAVEPDYYLLTFKTRAATGEFRRRSTGLGTGESGFMRLYFDSFGDVYLPVPPLKEQAEIVRHLTRLDDVHNQTVSRVAREVQLLREFRTRLTSDVVTGQVDVRDIASTLPEFTAEVLNSATDRFADEGLDDSPQDGGETYDTDQPG